MDEHGKRNVLHLQRRLTFSLGPEQQIDRVAKANYRAYIGVTACGPDHAPAPTHTAVATPYVQCAEHIGKSKRKKKKRKEAMTIIGTVEVIKHENVVTIANKI